MVTVLDTLKRLFLSDHRAARAFVTGSADVANPVSTFWSFDSQETGATYASYPATSNAVYACINARTKALTSLPIRLYSKRLDGDGKRTEISAGPARELLDKINPFWTFERWLDMTEQSLCVWGESFTFFEKSGNRPVEMWWARADRVTVHRHPTEYISHFTYDTGNGPPIRFERDETLWLRYPNVADQWEGLSPLAAARLSADTANAAMRSNYNIFINGLTAAGMVSPKDGQHLTEEQAKAVSDDLSRRFKGVRNAHRIAVLRFGVDIKQLSLTPKDAQFIEMMNWSLEDVARAFVVPIDKIGGRRTYQNVEESEKVFWSGCIVPEAQFIASEITEQLLPLFGGDMVAEFDMSNISVLQESEQARWERWKSQIELGVRLPNEFRASIGLDPLPWGDAWWAPVGVMPVTSEERPVLASAIPALGTGDGKDDEEEDRNRIRRLLQKQTRAMEYGSPEHRALIERRNDIAEPWEQQIGETCARLMQDQRQSVLTQLRKRSRTAEELMQNPFDRTRWIKSFRTRMRPVVEGVVGEAATLAATELGIAFAFDVLDPNVVRAIERQVQRFAEEVNETTWQMLRDEIKEGIVQGEDIDAIADRVENVMQDRIRSSKEAVARTETTRASTTGTVETWKQTGVVVGKRWVAALDARTRATHIEAHGQVVGLNDYFHVGAATGPGPGDLDIAGEVVNCRCTVSPVIDVDVKESK